MAIEFIQNGMELSQVRDILNNIIKIVNDREETKLSYYDLQDQPCINGIELTAKTSANELHITLSELDNIQDIKRLVAEIGEQRAEEVATEVLKTKLDSDLTLLPELQYNFNEDMLVTINDKGDNYKAKISDLLLYLKYLILKDITFGKMLGNNKEAILE